MSAIALELKRAGRRIGLAPTMGSLHEGHLSLVRLLGGECEVKVASIFVNPTQFGPSEDLARYPRDEARDLAMLASADCHLAFCPGIGEIYPPDFQTNVEVERLSEPLCGRFRPGHFRGVATVVLKLFNITRCDVAVFGLKDFQQAMLIRRMVRDLDLPVRLLFGATLREADGLAMSSRNVFLSPAERAAARSLPRALERARLAAASGEQNAERIIAETRRELEAEPGVEIQYIEVVNPETLQPCDRIGRRAQLAVALFAGRTRLIDNTAVGPDGDPMFIVPRILPSDD